MLGAQSDDEVINKNALLEQELGHHQQQQQQQTDASTNAGADPTSSSSSSPAHAGVIPRSVARLFEQIEAKKLSDTSDNTTFSVHCSFLQIYNEKLYDLLSSMNQSSTLSIREAKNRSQSSGKVKVEVFVSGLSEYRVESAADVMNLVEQGSRVRALRSTEFNDASSRSHAVLQLSVESVNRGDGFSVLRKAKLNLVDLAGSEKMNAASSAAEMSVQHVNELSSINTSLSALGNVMAALSQSNRSHVPYR
jgi:hypothetical protein